MFFYKLDRSITDSNFSELKRVVKANLVEPPQCDACGVKLGNLLVSPPYKYKLVRKTPGDFISKGLEFAVSQRFLDLYSESPLTGLSFSDSAIELTNSDLKYYIAFPIHSRTLIDEAQSGAVIHNVRGCEKCRVMSLNKIEQVVIQEETWEGYDCFLLGSLFSVVLVTQRFVDFTEKHKLTNFNFIPQDQIHWDYTSVLN